MNENERKIEKDIGMERKNENEEGKQMEKKAKGENVIEKNQTDHHMNIGQNLY
jgi:hypothetical protein